MMFHFGYSQEIPKVLKTKFSKEALAHKLQDKNGKEMTGNSKMLTINWSTIDTILVGSVHNEFIE